MSWRLVGDVLHGRLPVAVLSPRDTLVLLVLAEHADDDGTNAWPSIDRIACMARMKRRTVQDALRSLKDAGAIVQDGKKMRGVVRWRIVTVDPQESAYEGRVENPQESAYEGPPLSSADSRTDEAGICTPGGQESAYNPSLNPSRTPTPGGEGGKGQEQRSPSSRAVVQAHGVLTDLAVRKGLPAPSRADVEKAGRDFPDPDLVEVALALVADPPRVIKKSVVGLFRSRLQRAPERDLRFDREALLEQERLNREDRERRIAGYEAAAQEAAVT